MINVLYVDMYDSISSTVVMYRVDRRNVLAQGMHVVGVPIRLDWFPAQFRSLRERREEYHHRVSLLISSYGVGWRRNA